MIVIGEDTSDYLTEVEENWRIRTKHHVQFEHFIESLSK